MKTKPTLIGLVASLLVLGSAPVLAQSNAVLDELREEIRKLRAEVNELKKQKAAEAKPADASGWGERIEQLEIKSKDAVVLGDIGGSFRLPGSETSLRFYGYAETHAIHDFREVGSSDFFTDLMYTPVRGSAQKGKTKFTAATSRFGFESSTPTDLGAFNAKVEADFYSYGSSTRNRLRLRHAYGEYAGFLVGQTWSTFMDLDNLPETVDFNGPIGAPFSRRAMIRYTYNNPQFAKLTFALEDPEDQFGGGSANERMPQFVARFDKSFDWGAINVRALAHEKRSAGETKRGFGFGVGGSFKLGDSDLLMGQFARVDGDIDQMYGSNGYDIDADTGAITFDKNKGIVLGWAHTYSGQLRGTVAFGHNRAERATALADNKRLSQLFVNLIYSPIKNIELGAELIVGDRKTFLGEKGQMRRVDLMGRYSF
ncbi:DcaP family trimeric outer membrane transporter [Aquabacterium humicola]|uniref:DcaP family trimeric outer membrane transporter n=1 Tax=Aquabacterium humicola TaxID=3237377 RepID=UPI002543868A|nr:DcaP family trimeric outer membrane transporter [Rubrivivax pictus]